MEGLLRDLAEFLRKESHRPLGKLSLAGAMVIIGIAFFLKQWGLPVFLYGLIFHRASWLIARAIALAAALAAALFFAMRPVWGGKQSRLPPALTLIVIFLLFARFLLAGFLMCLGAVFYFILGVVFKLVSGVGGTI